MKKRARTSIKNISVIAIPLQNILMSNSKTNNFFLLSTLPGFNYIHTNSSEKYATKRGSYHQMKNTYTK